MHTIKKILIANRGEIALRIMKTCREMGISTVAVYSDADKNSLHVKEADTAIHIGNSPAAQSYLNIENIISAAKKTGADAIHPGYGFLAENASFARRCEEEKIIFIGPASESIEKMGSKAEAKQIMRNSAVPVVPGYEGDDQSFEKLAAEVDKIGFPIVLKASAGGGGKGMRIVRKKEELKTAVEAAQREARSAFADDRLIIEKYFDSCRHIEIQIFGDKNGNAIHLFERECTIQRRHQKIIEESPSPVLSPELREKMAIAAVNAAKAINYCNAGTVEFILTSDPNSSLKEKGEDIFYFLEVNTRLQVEHPVTESITGFDLVKMQIEIAEGKLLVEIIPPGLINHLVNSQKGRYAIECRLYAEDPENNFLPQSGKIWLWKPALSEDMRFDSGIETGSTVDIFYDPMLAKVIAKGIDRGEAIRKMIYALKNTVCLGITTNKEFLIQILQNNDFEKGNYNTHFVEKLNHAEKEMKGADVFLIAAFLYQWKLRQDKSSGLKNNLAGWRNNYYADQQEAYLINENEFSLIYRNISANNFVFTCKEKSYRVEFFSALENCIKFYLDCQLHTAYIAISSVTEKGSNREIFVHHSEYGQIKLVLLSRFPQKKSEDAKGNYISPMPGEVVKIDVKPGDKVKKGDSLIVLLSMKMENTIVAHSDGIVEEIFITEKLFVKADTVLLKMSTI